MSGIVFLLLSLCPVLDTGKFSFREFVVNPSGVDTFYGRVYSEGKKRMVTVSINYPEKQVFEIRNDTVFAVFDADTQVIYRKGLEKLLFYGRVDKGFMEKKIDGGCFIFPSDTSLMDTLFIYGSKYIDSLYYVSGETKIKAYLGRDK